MGNKDLRHNYELNIVRFRRFILFIGFLLMFFVMGLNIKSVSADVYGKISLLAVTTLEQGSVLDLELKIAPGDGSLYVDSFPLSKLDTIASIRFAKEFACQWEQIDCSNLNFYYKIHSDSFEVEGPSAGIALTTLTILLLQHVIDGDNGYFDYSKSLALTGTINAAGYVGDVDGIKAKVNAALNRKITHIFIPNEQFKNDSLLNFTNCKQIQKSQVCKVNNVYDIFNELGMFKQKVAAFNSAQKQKILLPKYYDDVMKSISNNLCSRAKSLIDNLDPTRKKWVDKYNLSRDYYKGLDAVSLGQYYSGASLCLTSNIAVQKLIQTNSDLLNVSFNLSNSSKIKLKQLLIGQIKKVIDQIKYEQKLANQKLDEIENKKIKGITDFQTKLIVLERVNDAIDNLNINFSKYLSLNNQQNNSQNNSNITQKNINLTTVRTRDLELLLLNYRFLVSKLSYSIERLYTIGLWELFFGKDTKKINLDDRVLKNLCIKKISEAEERYSFVKYYFSALNRPEDLKKADRFLIKREYASCIFFATKAKAELDATMSQSENITVGINQKLKLLKYSIIKQINSGYFPILGYSYYEYANVLKKFDKNSAYIFSQEGTEFSNIQMYLKNNGKKIKVSKSSNYCQFPENLANLDYRSGIIDGIKLTVSVIVLLLVLFCIFCLLKGDDMTKIIKKIRLIKAFEVSKCKENDNENNDNENNNDKVIREFKQKSKDKIKKRESELKQSRKNKKHKQEKPDSKIVKITKRRPKR